MNEEGMPSNSSSGSFGGSPRCPLCFEQPTQNDRLVRVIHPTESEQQHTACTTCLQRLLGNKTQLTCPHCRKVVHMTEPFVNLPVYTGEDQSLSIDDVTNLKKVIAANEDISCTSCGEPAFARCENCRIHLCNDCKSTHQRVKSSRSHTVRDLSSLSEEDRANFQEVSWCDEHGQAVDMYCSHCEVTCCLKCDEHRKHGYVELKDVLAKKGEHIKKEGRRILERKHEIGNHIKELKKMKETITKSKRDSEEAINKTATTIMNNVKKKEARLLNQVSDGTKRLIAGIDEEIKKRQEIMDITGEVESCSEQVGKLDDTKQLELYKKIERGLMSLDNIELKVEPSSDGDHEGYLFVSNNEGINDLEELEIGHVYSSLTLQEDDQLSNKATCSEVGDFEIRVLAIGKRRSGRTKTLVASMTQEVYISSRVESAPGLGQWRMCHKGRTFLLSKTPGLDAIGHGDVEMEKSDVEKVTHPGPHVILLTIQNPDEDVRVLGTYMELFQEDLHNFLIIVFTGKKDLDKKGVSVNSYVQTRHDRELSKVLSAVRGRYVAVNTDDKDNLPIFREKFFKCIRDLVRVNGQRYLVLK